MSRRFLTTLASALLAVAIVVGGSAIAAGKKSKTYKIQGTVHSHASGDGTKIAGSVNDKYFGAGAIVYPNAKAGKAVTVKYTAFAKTGAYYGTTTADITLNPGPPASVSITKCTFKVKGGYGALKGAKGKGTCSGSGNAAGYDTLTYQGKITVP